MGVMAVGQFGHIRLLEGLVPLNLYSGYGPAVQFEGVQ